MRKSKGGPGGTARTAGLFGVDGDRSISDAMKSGSLPAL
jgi:hypothetical protein